MKRYIVFCVLFVCLNACTRPVSEDSTGTPDIVPNIIMISLDTLRADHLGCYGHPEIRTPVIDRISRNGLLCSDHHVNSNWTLPSHASMFTSMYVADHRMVYDNRPMPDSIITLAELLRDSGYRTGGFYSVHHFSPQLNMTKGFDLMEFYDWVDGADWTRITDWLSAESEQPFFLFLHTFEPHAPYGGYREYQQTEFGRNLRDLDAFESFTKSWEAGETDIDWLDYREGMMMMLLGFQKGEDRHSDRIQEKVARMTDAQLRLWRHAGEVPITNEIDPWFDSKFFQPDVQAMIDNYVLRVEKTDREMQRLLKELYRSGHLENTVICITSDHGETFFERDRVYGHGGNRRDYIDPYLVADSSFHTELICTPLILHAPEQLNFIPRYVEPHLTSALDIMPSLLHAANIMIPQGLAGTTILDGAPDNRFTIVENQRTMRRALITSDWKLITGLEPVELYDRRHDPAELVNKSHIAVETLNILETKFQNWAQNRFLRFEPEDTQTDPELRRHLQLLGYLHDPDNNSLL